MWFVIENSTNKKSEKKEFASPTETKPYNFRANNILMDSDKMLLVVSMWFVYVNNTRNDNGMGKKKEPLNGLWVPQLKMNCDFCKCVDCMLIACLPKFWLVQAKQKIIDYNLCLFFLLISDDQFMTSDNLGLLLTIQYYSINKSFCNRIYSQYICFCRWAIDFMSKCNHYHHLFLNMLSQ